MGNYRHNLSKRVRQILNIGMEEFCKKYLDTEIKAFQYRMRNKSCYPNEIIYISWLLGEGVEDLFGSEFTEMMISDGPDFVTNKIKSMFEQADDKQRQDYMKFIGVHKTELNLPQQEEEIMAEKVVKVKVKEKKVKENHDAPKSLVEFFQDVVVTR